MKDNHLKKVLIAEDDPDILEILKVITENAGYHVEVTSDGKSLLEERDQWPDLIIMDRIMPGVDGLNICKHLRGQPTTQLIPIIMISATQNLASLAKNAGANDFLEKPFNIDELLKLVIKYLDAS